MYTIFQILGGPQSADDLVRIELTETGNTDIRPIHARYIRIQSEMDNDDGVGLRLEVFGCPEASKSALCNVSQEPQNSSCSCAHIFSQTDNSVCFSVLPDIRRQSDDVIHVQ